MINRVTSQLVQVGRLAVGTTARVTSQIVQVAKGFLLREVTVQTQAYPKNNPTSFFSRRGEKTFIVGHNKVRVTSQVVQVARLVVPN